MTDKICEHIKQRIKHILNAELNIPDVIVVPFINEINFKRLVDKYYLYIGKRIKALKSAQFNNNNIVKRERVKSIVKYYAPVSLVNYVMKELENRGLYRVRDKKNVFIS